MSEMPPSVVETFPHEIVLEPGLWRIRLTEVDPISCKTLSNGKTIEGPLQLNRIHTGPGTVSLTKPMFIGAGNDVPVKVTPPVSQIFKHGETYFVTLNSHTFRFEIVGKVEQESEEKVEKATGWFRKKFGRIF